MSAPNHAPPPATVIDPSPMWLAHHDAAHLDRCVRAGRVHLCRRCSVFYPIAIICAVAIAATAPPTSIVLLAMWVLPAPMAAEWIGEQLGRLRYSPARQVTLSALGAPALGAALALHAQQPFTLLAVLPMLWWALCCGITAAVAAWRRAPSEDAGWLERHELDEARRHEHFVQLLDGTDPTAQETTQNSAVQN